MTAAGSKNYKLPDARFSRTAKMTSGPLKIRGLELRVILLRFVWRFRRFAPALCQFSKPSGPFCCGCVVFRIPSANGAPLRSAALRFVPPHLPMECSTQLRLAKRPRGLCKLTQSFRKTPSAPNSARKMTRSSVPSDAVLRR